MKSIGIMAHPNKKLFWDQFPDILKTIGGHGLDIICPDTFPDKRQTIRFLPESSMAAACDLILSFGGDGTMLRTIQLIGNQQTPVLGVNVGGLGFLTEVTLEDFSEVFKQIVQGKYHIEERILLEGRIKGQKKPMYALNEITIEKGRSTRVIEVDVEIDGKYFNNFIADGLIISTPTGSTGYSLSSNGPIVMPASQCIILNPICPHSLTNRPVILPSGSKVSSQIFTEHPVVLISADNQDVREVPSRTRLEIHSASFRARLVKPPDSDYFSLLRNKLNWGGDVRNKLTWSYNR